jgi:hypothetical protein
VQVAHALQVGAHAQARDEDPQVGRHRLLAREEVEGPLLSSRCSRSTASSAAMTLSGQLEVGVEQGRRRAAHRRPGEPGHLHQLIADGVELFVNWSRMRLLTRWQPSGCRAFV